MKRIIVITILLMSAIWSAHALWSEAFDDYYFAQVTAAAGGATATGGTITNYTEGGTNFQAHIFLSNDTFAVSGGTLACDVLIVAGGAGGGGGVYHPGGGGAGGLVYGTNYTASGNITVTVGTGGLGGDGRVGEAYSDGGSNGYDSTFGLWTALGGGGGQAETRRAAQDGGSGGGATKSYQIGLSIQTNPAAGAIGYGNDGGGGNGSAPNYGSGGGGGAGAAGVTGTSTKGGDGGAGKQYSISGIATYYAGGGGGSAYIGTALNVGAGGTGGGGSAGQATGEAGYSGTDGTGGGGGAGYSHASNDGGDGGSGIVIVRYLK